MKILSIGNTNVEALGFKECIGPWVSDGEKKANLTV